VQPDAAREREFATEGFVVGDLDDEREDDVRLTRRASTGAKLASVQGASTQFNQDLGRDGLQWPHRDGVK